MSEADSNSKQTFVGLGEVLWDIFPDGPRFGGAPANYACSVAALDESVDVFMVSGVGSDELGQRALKELDQRRVRTDFVQQRSEQTGFVQVSLDDAGIATYEFAEDTAWDNLAWSDDLAALARRTGVVCFGTLGQRSAISAQTIQQFVSLVPKRALKIFDINLRPPYYSDEIIRQSLEVCNCLKLNDDELPVVADLLGLEGTHRKLLPLIAETYDLRTVVLTLGADGALLYDQGVIVESSGMSVEVADTVGAGDAFTAAISIGLQTRQVSRSDICKYACGIAGYVCSQHGATPSMPDEYRFKRVSSDK